jgi:hypothetical protein
MIMKQNICFLKPAGIILSLIVLTLQSCNVAYIPNMENVPLLQKKGDIVVNATGTNFQGAYGITDHLGVMVNTQFKSSSWTETDLGYKAQRNYFEGALGLFQTKEGNKTMEIYAGSGLGTLDFQNDWTYSGDPGKYAAKMRKVFIQPNIGIFGEYVDVAFSIRGVMLNFYNATIENYTEDELVLHDLKGLEDQPFYFIEPAFTFRGGYKWIKLQLQYLHSVKINPEKINYSSNRYMVGISIRF